MRISKANLPKISRFHHIPGSGTHGPHFLKIFLISFGFAYDFSLCQNNGFVRIIPRTNTEHPPRSEDLFGAIPDIWYKTYGGLIGPKNHKILEFQKVEIWKDNMFLRWFPIFFYLLKYFHDEYGEPGSTMGPKKWKFWKFQNPSKKYCNMIGDLN